MAENDKSVSRREEEAHKREAATKEELAIVVRERDALHEALQEAEKQVIITCMYACMHVCMYVCIKNA
jgi:hypothetical protein